MKIIYHNWEYNIPPIVFISRRRPRIAWAWKIRTGVFFPYPVHTMFGCPSLKTRVFADRTRDGETNKTSRVKIKLAHNAGKSDNAFQ